MRLTRPIESYVRVSWTFQGPTHRGLDLSAYVGTPVYAPVDGIAYVRTDTAASGGFGKYVRIETDGYKVYLAHLDEWRVRDGATVKRGALVGLSGNTGYSGGPHLHLEVRRLAGSPYLYGAVDPWPLIDWDGPRDTRPIGVHLGNDCPLRDADKDTIRRIRPGCVVLLPSYGVNQQKVGIDAVRWILGELPDCHIILRPYVPPSMAATDSGCSEYTEAVSAMLPEYVAVVPAGQLHLQLYNEQNMPRWAGWEGFGDQLADMERFDRMFTAGYQRIKGRYPSVLIGWTPLTIGNRDCWFPGDAAGHYYLHGPSGCYETHTMTGTQWAQARHESPCRASLSMADEHYAHIYVHHGNNDWRNAAYGLRFERYRHWWPEKPLWITEYGHPNRHYLTQPGGEQALIEASEYIRDNAPYVRGAALWLLGDNPQWGGEMYSPRSWIVGQLATVNAQGVPVTEPEPVPAEPLPNDEQGPPALLVQKARWWLEQMQREFEAGNLERAWTIRLSLIELLYRLEREMA